ncbi:alkaline shock response membrane anchor protein AmaP [Halanaerobaculum tunisiense]
MQYLDRFFVLLLTVLSIVISLSMIGLTLGWVDTSVVIELLNQDLQLTGIVGGVLFLISLRILQLFLPHRKSPQQTIIAHGDLGTIQISLEAIKRLTTEIVNQEVDAKEIKTNVEVIEGGVSIVLNLAIISQANVSELGEQLQAQVKEQVQASTGAQVEQVEILINEVSRTQESKDVILD